MSRVSLVILGFLTVWALPRPADAFLSVVRQGAESAGVPNTNDRHGRTVVAGDFDGDGYEDLAAAAPDESNGQFNTAVHGTVIISPGTSRGIGTQGIRQISVGDLGTEAARFGWSLVAADFNQDGYDDLGVGIPQLNSLGGPDRGAVWFYAGGPGGLQLAPYRQVAYEDVENFPQDHANFGWALTAGDFDDDGYPDVATSAIGQDNDTGVVYFLHGGASGITTNGSYKLYPYTVGGSQAQGGRFGWSLAAGQLNGLGGDDLVVGAPQTNVQGQVAAGRVYFYYASAAGVSAGNGWFRDASNLGNLATEGNAHLGFSLAVGHLYQISGQVDVAVGAPQDDYGAQDGAGSVLLFEFDSQPNDYDSAKKIRQHAIYDATNASPGDQFGYALAVGRFDIGNFEDLAVGAPYENVTEQGALGEQFDAGMFHVVYGQPGGPSMSNCDTFDATTINNFVNGGDLLGQSLCFGRFDNSSRDGLAVGAPSADYDSYESGIADIQNAGQVHIVAPWRQPQGRPHRTSVLFDCDGFILFGQRPFQRVRPASTTKTLTLLLACEAIWDGTVDPNDFYTIPGWVADQVGGSQTPLVEGEKLSFVGLMQTMMTVSGNDSAMLIGTILSGDGGPWEGWTDTDPTFAAMMETKANQLGLSGATSMTNAAGIDSNDHYVTALDWATLAWLAIQNECVHTIVDKSPWIVERVQPEDGTLDWFQVPGEMGDGEISIFEAFFAGWVDGVKARYPKAVGLKPGGTPGGWRTGLSAADPFGQGFSAASSFGTRVDDAPVEGVSGGCSTCLHADLLQFAEGYCPGGVPQDLAPTPDPGPQPWGTLTGIPPCPDEGIRAMTLNLAEEQTVPPGRVIQVDLLRNGYQDGQIPVRKMVSRQSQVLVQPDESLPFGIGPHQSNHGVEFRNDGDSKATFNVHWDGQILPFSLDPGETGEVAGDLDHVGAYNFIVESTQRTEMTLSIHEKGYMYDLLLEDGIVGPETHSVQLVRSGHLLAETITVHVRGVDDICGDDSLDLVARESDNVPTGVVDPEAFLPPAPVRVALLPNTPNPFNPSTTLRFDLPRAGSVDLAIYDLRGRLVQSVVAGRHLDAGRHRMQWGGRDDAGQIVASGVYLVRLRTADGEQTQRITLLK